MLRLFWKSHIGLTVCKIYRGEEEEQQEEESEEERGQSEGGLRRKKAGEIGVGGGEDEERDALGRDASFPDSPPRFN